MARPVPTRIFHITAIENLAAICNAGELACKNILHGKNVAATSIAHQGIQDRRALKAVTAGLGGNLHDYVPFYYAPRSPMLFAIHRGNVAGCDLKQDEIVHIESSVEGAAKAKLPYVIYPVNAALAYSTECYDTLDGLEKIDWPLFFEEPKLDGFCQYFASKSDPSKYMMRCETRQAEFLVHKSFPLSLVTRIGVVNAQRKAEVASILATSGVHLPLEIRSAWYF